MSARPVLIGHLRQWQLWSWIATRMASKMEVAPWDSHS